MKNFKLKVMALLFAIGFWFFVVSQQKYLLTLEVPLVISRVPEVLAIASSPPSTISVQVSGYVLDLLRIRSDKEELAVVINAQDVEQGWTHFTISAENFYAPEHPEIQYVEGERIRSLDIEFDTKIHRTIPVQMKTEFECASGYTFVEEHKITPSKIEVSGARTTLMSLGNIYTESGLHKDLKANSSFEVKIVTDSLPAYVQLKDSVVKVELAVQAIAQKTFHKIPVHLIGLYDKEKYALEPSVADVEITGGSEIIQSFKPEELDLFVEFSRFAIENTDELAASIRLTKNVKGYRIQPEKFALIEKNIQDTSKTTEVVSENP